MTTQEVLAAIAAQAEVTDTSKGYTSLTYWAARYVERVQRAVPKEEDRIDLVRAAAMLVRAIEMIDNTEEYPAPPPEEPTPETPEG
jgi:hypothetical protein